MLDKLMLVLFEGSFSLDYEIEVIWCLKLI